MCGWIRWHCNEMDEMVCEKHLKIFSGDVRFHSAIEPGRPLDVSISNLVARERLFNEWTGEWRFTTGSDRMCVSRARIDVIPTGFN